MVYTCTVRTKNCTHIRKGSVIIQKMKNENVHFSVSWDHFGTFCDRGIKMTVWGQGFQKWSLEKMSPECGPRQACAFFKLPCKVPKTPEGTWYKHIEIFFRLLYLLPIFEKGVSGNNCEIVDNMKIHVPGVLLFSPLVGPILPALELYPQRALSVESKWRF